MPKLEYSSGPSEVAYPKKKHPLPAATSFNSFVGSAAKSRSLAAFGDSARTPTERTTGGWGRVVATLPI